MGKKLDKKGFSFKTLLGILMLALVVLYLSWSFINNRIQISAKAQQLNTLQEQLAEQLAVNDELNRQLEEGEESLIEQTARDELGYARPNERVFVDMSGK